MTKEQLDCTSLVLRQNGRKGQAGAFHLARLGVICSARLVVGHCLTSFLADVVDVVFDGLIR